ncbi:TPA: UDP-N-acetylenolpyruvoylglucosamine reductase [Candidatus Campbellbacteria bacterium]|nr:MAG: UDP-N-acetylenolpyruvoylglucosamine reductase, UDP-N-acetylmuramate dehydrogenase [Candidatus Campbellbacteria bacterium GW2011_OD1_34_28]KKP75458.1 MAG: UDP-N-acetylenolpyruvoylglucosamine reductase [Candidatus Campbellbacteria bacterium GW2011_GWD2_35_24]KKP75981.1 MAG: UDP-N-acetylenolpyruvoylglucosamine reductase, UDP-N-acetylmuramate dehydrogenase [Candidatus Campbellbacteria bacterium GW2011_GWC2_35_28]KKP77170.1 MAG: UDP-N-acetylenolpyruvoylglucosamine reductase [Candidatus Campbe
MNIEENVLLADYTTFKIGGCARYFAVIKNEEDLKGAVIFAKQNQLPLYILGGGSNLLISDEGVDGLVLKIEIKGVTWDSESQVIVGAGEVWDDLVQQTVDKNLYGLENLSYIPGTVGASVVQNIECYGAEVKDSVESVEVFNIETLEIEILTNKQCDFIYRHSIFKTEEGKKYIILRVNFVLKKEGTLNLDYKDVKNYLKENNLEEKNVSLGKMREILLFIRKNKLPDLKQFGTAGSFFKLPVVNSETLFALKKISPDMPHYKIDIGCNTSLQGEHKIPLGHLLEQFGWKGYKDGEAGIFEKHSLIVINHGNATAKDVKNLVEKIAKDVKEKTGINIETEVVMW